LLATFVAVLASGWYATFSCCCTSDLKIGPFKPLAFSQQDLERAVEAIITKIQEVQGENK
jgi:hypothetical protein